jgi:hypothetical protein
MLASLNRCCERWLAALAGVFLAMDEMTISYFGRNALRLYNPNKPNKYGPSLCIVLGLMCRAHRYHFKIYAAASSGCLARALPHVGKGGSIVTYLSNCLPMVLQALRHVVVIDRFYMSPISAIFMFVFRKIHVLGTCIPNKQGCVCLSLHL